MNIIIKKGTYKNYYYTLSYKTMLEFIGNNIMNLKTAKDIEKTENERSLNKFINLLNKFK